MEQNRMLIAIVLSFLVLIVWQKIFVEKKEVQSSQKVSQTEMAEKDVVFEKEITQKDLEEIKKKDATDTSARIPREITIETKLFIARVTEKGGALKSIRLKNYRETIDNDSPLKEVLDPENSVGTLICGFKKNSIPGLQTALYTAEFLENTVFTRDEKVEIPFRWTDQNGVILEKRYIFSPDSYQIDLSISIMNGANIPLQDQLTVNLVDSVPDKPRRIGHTGPSAMIGNHVTLVNIKKHPEKNTFSGNIVWTAYQQRYFMSALIPEKTTDATLHFNLNSNNYLESQIELKETVIRPQTQQTFFFHAYFGPKNISILKTIGKELDKVVDFGWFSFLARPCLWIMNFLHRYIPNYGITIIIITILMKIALWPLGSKSYKSMGQMKKIQPLMADIRERYKSDKQRMNQEMMSLYKTYKVNPLGGCLPMVLQIPIFFALYRMLYEAIELRHAPFFGWINDLSAPDRLFHFGFKIPFMEPPYGIPVLTLIMGASMFLQQKMQPPMGDATQAKMMLIFMPVFMTVIFINFSSGLVLYWLVSNILGILQQYYVNKKTA